MTLRSYPCLPLKLPELFTNFALRGTVFVALGINRIHMLPNPSSHSILLQFHDSVLLQEIMHADICVRHNELVSQAAHSVPTYVGSKVQIFSPVRS